MKNLPSQKVKELNIEFPPFNIEYIYIKNEKFTITKSKRIEY